MQPTSTLRSKSRVLSLSKEPISIKAERILGAVDCRSEYDWKHRDLIVKTIRNPATVGGEKQKQRHKTQKRKTKQKQKIHTIK